MRKTFISTMASLGLIAFSLGCESSPHPSTQPVSIGSDSVDLDQLDLETSKAKRDAWKIQEAANERRAEYALRVFQTIDRFEIFSLDPNLNPPKGAKQFHSWRIVGSATVENSSIRDALHDALVKGISEERERLNGRFQFVGCFNPRHGLRFRRDDQKFEFLICFKCSQVKFYENGLEFLNCDISRTPQLIFDDTLRQLGLEVTVHTNSGLRPTPEK